MVISFSQQENNDAQSVGKSLNCRTRLTATIDDMPLHFVEASNGARMFIILIGSSTRRTLFKLHGVVIARLCSVASGGLIPGAPAIGGVPAAARKNVQKTQAPHVYHTET